MNEEFNDPQNRPCPHGPIKDGALYTITHKHWAGAKLTKWGYGDEQIGTTYEGVITDNLIWEFQKDQNSDGWIIKNYKYSNHKLAMWGDPTDPDNFGTFSGAMNVDQVWNLRKVTKYTNEPVYEIFQTYSKEQFGQHKGKTFGLSKWSSPNDVLGITSLPMSDSNHHEWIIESVYDVEIGWQLLFQFDNQDEHNTTVAFEYTTGFSALESNNNVNQV